jgi:membrane-associated protease RseP (regulator of RpoE activity)
MYRTKLGIKLMDKLATKYREQVKLFGYIVIGLGFIGMLYISFAIVMMFIGLIMKPAATEASMALVLPFTNIPGIGYLSFWHWIISIFILAVLHEFSHGVVARAHGLQIKSSGFAVFGIILPILPAAFVEPNEKKLAKENDVVQYSVFAAGPAINIILAFIIVLALPYTADMGNMTLAPYEDKISEPVGISFKLINETVPAAISGMKDNMVITKLNGNTVKDYTDFRIYLLRITPNDTIKITANNTVYTIKTGENPENLKLAYVGIQPLKNERKIIDGKEGIAGVYYWFKGLFKWLFLLNFFIGIANLLPLGIVDGGRMLQVALGKTVKNKEKAKKIWTYIALLFFILLLIGILTSYFGNPLALLK